MHQTVADSHGRSTTREKNEQRPKEPPLGHPKITYTYGSGSLWFEWRIAPDYLCRIEIAPVRNQAIIRNILFSTAGDPNSVGGVPASVAHDCPIETLAKRSMEYVQRMVEERLSSRNLARLAGFTHSNVDTPIRPRGRRPASDLRVAALALRYADGETARTIAHDIHLSENQVRKMIAEARYRGFLSRKGRELAEKALLLLYAKDLDRIFTDAGYSRFLEEAQVRPISEHHAITTRSANIEILFWGEGSSMTILHP